MRLILAKPLCASSPAYALRSKLARAVLLAGLTGALAACSSLGGAGPSGADVRNVASASSADSGIEIVDLNSDALARVRSHSRSTSFAEVFGEIAQTEITIGRGDIIDVSLWEAPPAVLFGVTSSDARLSANPLVAQSAAIPQRIVGVDGNVSIPFVGSIHVAGQTISQVEQQILARLRGKAHDPQAVVRLVQNESRSVTIIGEVANSRRMPLGAKGERVLDAIASAGGPREAISKSTVQLSRGGMAASMRLEQVVSDPAQNIRLMPDDVVALLYQPYSFTALGAVARNAEIPFEGSGLSLAEALGRVGGLRDDRADIRGVFVFRMAEPAALDPSMAASARQTAEGRVPVIYRLDMSDPAGIFAAQDFQVNDKDIVYVSAAPGADLQRFISALSGAAFSVVGLGSAIK